MKKFLSAALCMTLGAFCVQAQTLVLKPGPAAGEDATIMTSYGCTLSSQPGPAEGLNGGSSPELPLFDWTFNAQGCSHGTARSLIRFTGLSAIPPGATILSATLNLYGVPTSPNSQGNSSYPGAPYGTTNEGWVRQVTSGWSENTVTWNTIPTTTLVNQEPIPVTGTRWNWNTSVNVTNMVANMVATSTNEGFELSLNNEAIYRSQFYASSDNANSDLWPELIVRYSACNAGFKYCSSTDNPYLYDFSPNSTTAAYTEWTVDGTSVYSGAPSALNYFFPGPGTHKVCLTVQEKGQEKCTKCITLCIADNGKPIKPTEDLTDGAKKSPSVQPVVPQLGELHFDMNAIRMENVSPNPTKTGWNASILSASAIEADVALYDLTGRLITRYSVDLAKGENSIQVNAEKLPAGSYLLKVTAPGTANLQTTVVKY